MIDKFALVIKDDTVGFKCAGVTYLSGKEHWNWWAFWGPRNFGWQIRFVVHLVRLLMDVEPYDLLEGATPFPAAW